MIKSITSRFSAWRLERETIRELSMLSNRELADLGIGRGDIAFVASGALHRVDGPVEISRPVSIDASRGTTSAAQGPTALAA